MMGFFYLPEKEEMVSLFLLPLNLKPETLNPL